jgi:hypothetical protein
LSGGDITLLKFVEASDLSPPLPALAARRLVGAFKGESQAATPAVTPAAPFVTMTYSTHNRAYFCLLLRSAVAYHIPIEVLAFGSTNRKIGYKLGATMEALREMPSDTVVLFVDGFDVVLMSEAGEILEKFFAFNTPLLFAAEKGCWPFVMDDKKICTHVYPDSPTEYRYLNSGTWMGYAGAALSLFEDIMQAHAGQNVGNMNDQGLRAVPDHWIQYYCYSYRNHGVDCEYLYEILRNSIYSSNSSDNCYSSDYSLLT